MEFVKMGDKYLIKNSGGRVVTEKEMLKLQNEDLILQDIKSDECQGKTTQKLTKNKAKIEEIEKTEKTEENDILKVVEIIKPKKKKANAKKVEAKDDTIEETD